MEAEIGKELARLGNPSSGGSEELRNQGLPGGLLSTLLKSCRILVTSPWLGQLPGRCPTAPATWSSPAFPSPRTEADSEAKLFPISESEAGGLGHIVLCSPRLLLGG